MARWTKMYFSQWNPCTMYTLYTVFFNMCSQRWQCYFSLLIEDMPIVAWSQVHKSHFIQGGKIIAGNNRSLLWMCEKEHEKPFKMCCYHKWTQMDTHIHTHSVYLGLQQVLWSWSWQLQTHGCLVPAPLPPYCAGRQNGNTFFEF